MAHHGSLRWERWKGPDASIPRVYFDEEENRLVGRGLAHLCDLILVLQYVNACPKPLFSLQTARAWVHTNLSSHLTLGKGNETQSVEVAPECPTSSVIPSVGSGPSEVDCFIQLDQLVLAFLRKFHILRFMTTLELPRARCSSLTRFFYLYGLEHTVSSLPHLWTRKTTQVRAGVTPIDFVNLVSCGISLIYK